MKRSEVWFVVGAFAIATVAALACSSSNDDPPAKPIDERTGVPICSTPPPTYPSGPYGLARGDTIEDVELDGVGLDGTKGKVRLSASLSSCVDSQRVLVLRVGASFCGTCNAAARSTSGLANQTRLRIIDVLARDEDNETPEIDAATRWQAIQDRKTEVAILTETQLERFIVPQTALPRVLIVDPVTMKIEATLADPAPEQIENAAAKILARIDGHVSEPNDRPIDFADGRFTRTQMKMIKEMVLTGGPPPDPTNAYADHPGAASLGRKLFDDRKLSPSLEVSCERCHETSRSFTDGSEVATGGLGGGSRNTPSVILSAWSPRWQLWDGRADTLWMQALLPMEDAKEFGSSRLFVVHRVYDAHRLDYESVFGPMQLRFDDLGIFPEHGKPGDALYEAMSPENKEAVTRVFVNVGKSMAAFERSFRVLPNLLDRYARGETDALDPKQRDGLKSFFDSGCAQCHWGNRLTDDSFHVMRFPSGHEDFTPDDGRIEAAKKFESNEFRADSKWSDAPTPKRNLLSHPKQRGSFKTPALRGVVATPPYGHGGSVPALPMAVELHRTLGMPEGNRLTTGVIEPWVVPFDPSKDASLIAFIQTLGFSR